MYFCFEFLTSLKLWDQNSSLPRSIHTRTEHHQSDGHQSTSNCIKHALGKIVRTNEQHSQRITRDTRTLSTQLIHFDWYNVNHTPNKFVHFADFGPIRAPAIKFERALIKINLVQHEPDLIWNSFVAHVTRESSEKEPLTCTFLHRSESESHHEI